MNLHLDGKLKGKKIAILIEDLFNVFELWYPYYRLLEEGAEVNVVSPVKGKTYSGKPATDIVSELSAGESKASDFDAVVIPGGYAPDIMRRYPEMVRFVKEMHDTGKIVAAICHAGWMLCSADIVKNRNVTSFFAIKDDLVHAGARWEDKDVIRDKNIITSRKPDDLPVFMKTVINALTGQ